MKEKATKTIGQFVFKGSNGSLGYQTGNNYLLRVFMQFNGSNAEIVIDSVFKDEDNTERCIYSSVKAFQKNWELKSIHEGPNVFDEFDEICKGATMQLDEIIDEMSCEVK